MKFRRRLLGRGCCRSLALGTIYLCTLVVLGNLVATSLIQNDVITPTPSDRRFPSTDVRLPMAAPPAALSTAAPDTATTTSFPYRTRVNRRPKSVDEKMSEKPQLAVERRGATILRGTASAAILDRHKTERDNRDRRLRGREAWKTTLVSEDLEVDGVRYPLIREGNFIAMRRIVHLDLKGAPFRVAYFVRLFPVLARLNATGVLIEWEDMFPYTGVLASAVNGNAYSVQDVRTILQAAKDAHLDVIPLVQTFGHLEWILKLREFAHLRENVKYPQVFCFAEEEAWRLIQDMIAQVVAIHKPFGLKYFHIGADEAFQVGECEASRRQMAAEGGKQRVILWHIGRTANHVRQVTGNTSTVLAWHDMFAHCSRQDLRKYRLPELVEPVVWSYAENLDMYLHQNTWTALAAFPYVWGASAFKGADGPMRYHSNPLHYIRNHQSWLRQMNRHHASFRQLRGLMLTGWSRYDHLAVLCEILPVGFPALAISLLTISRGKNDVNYDDLVPVIGCRLNPHPGQVTPNCKFPGSRIYELINEFRIHSERLHSTLLNEYEFNGWLSRTAARYNISSPMYLDKIQPAVHAFLQPMERIENELTQVMAPFFFPDAIQELIFEHMGADLELLRQRNKAADIINNVKYFPKRPFFVNSTGRQQQQQQGQQQQQQQQQQGQQQGQQQQQQQVQPQQQQQRQAKPQKQQQQQ